MISSNKELERLYDLYSAVLYGIALRVSPSEKEAEEILISTFQKAHDQNLKCDDRSICMRLIKVLLATALERLGSQFQDCSDPSSKCFASTPLIQNLIFDHRGLEQFCLLNGLSKSLALIQLRNEYLQLRDTQPAYH